MIVEITSSSGKMVGTLNVKDYMFYCVVKGKGVGIPIPKTGGYVFYIRGDKLSEQIIIPPQSYFIKLHPG